MKALFPATLFGFNLRSTGSSQIIFFLLWILLLAQNQAPLVRAQHMPETSYAQSPNLAELESPCLLHPELECHIVVSSHQTILLDGRHTTPPNLHLQFTQGGMWDIQGGTLILAGGQFDAPDDTRIFTPTSFIRGLRSARPEWFADPSPEGYPPSALARAYRSTNSGGTILLRNTIYLSPFFDPSSKISCLGNTLAFNTPRSLIGMQRPSVDDDRHPTRLHDGTIIRGEICGTAGLRASSLGVDEGPYVVDHLFGGHPSYGIALSRTGALHQTKGTSLRDIAILTSNMESQHSVIVEGQDDLEIQGLWIWTRGGTHGLVVKSSNVTVRDFHCKGASSDCLIVKSDAATDDAGYASDVLIDDVHISALERPGDTGGIYIDSRWDSVHHIVLDHIVEEQTAYGIAASGSIFHLLHNISVKNWSAEVSNYCFALAKSDRFTIEHFRCTLISQQPSPYAFRIEGKRTLLRDGTITGAFVDGVIDLGTATTLDRLTAIGLSGYLLRYLSNHEEIRNGLSVSFMDDRLVALYQPPAESFAARLQRWIATLKPILRILYTAAVTRWRLIWTTLQSRLNP